VQTLSETVGMLGFLFALDGTIEVEPDAAKTLKTGADAVLDRAISELKAVQDFSAENLEAVLRAAIVDDMGVKPRLAFGPLRVALSGRRVSPPLFESMEILGKDSTLTRLARLKEQVSA